MCDGFGQRIAIEGEFQRFTFRQTRRTVAMTFSIMLVQASDRRSWSGNPSRVTVRTFRGPEPACGDGPGRKRSRSTPESITATETPLPSRVTATSMLVSLVPLRQKEAYEQSTIANFCVGLPWRPPR